MSNVAINKQTGEILILDEEGKWSPAPRATNPQTGEQLYSDGSQWLPVPQKPRTAGESLARGTGLAARSLGPIIAGAGAGAAGGALIGGVGAIPGAFAGATAAALSEPLSDLAVSAYNYFANKQQPLPSQAIDTAMTRMGLPQPETSGERIASTALRATADALTGARTAQTIAGALPRNTTSQRVFETLGENPVVFNPRIPFTKQNFGIGAQELAATTAATTTQGAMEAGAPPALALPAGVVAGSVPFLARPQNIFPNTYNEVGRENVQALKAAGIPLTPAQELGNPAARVTESVMRFLPTSAPKVARVEDEQMRAYTGRLLKEAGIDADIATPDVLTKGRQRFGKSFDELERLTSIDKGVNEKLFDNLLQIERSYVDGFPDSVRPTFRKRVDDILNYAAGEKGAEGRTYHKMQSQLSEDIARAARSNDPSASDYASALMGLQKALADAMEESAPKGLRDRWAQLNRQYAVFSRIEDTMARAGGDKLNTGFIPPRQIAAVEASRRGTNWAEGRDDFTRLLRAGAGILPDPVPNSGTAQRSFVQDLMTGGKRGAPAVAAGGAAEAAGISLLDPTLALGLPYLASRAWYAPRMAPEVQGLLGARSIEASDKAARKRRD